MKWAGTRATSLVRHRGRDDRTHRFRVPGAQERHRTGRGPQDARNPDNQHPQKEEHQRGPCTEVLIREVLDDDWAQPQTPGGSAGINDHPPTLRRMRHRQGTGQSLLELVEENSARPGPGGDAEESPATHPLCNLSARINTQHPVQHRSGTGHSREVLVRDVRVRPIHTPAARARGFESTPEIARTGGKSEASMGGPPDAKRQLQPERLP